MIQDEIDKQKEDLKEYYPRLILSQYQNEENINFVKNIIEKLTTKSPFELQYFFDLQNAEGEWLTKLAETVFGINRAFDNVVLNDDELRKVCQFAIVKRNIKILSFEAVGDMLFDVFGLNVVATAQNNKMIYFITEEFLDDSILKAVVRFKLLPVPIGAKLELIKKPPLDTRYLLIVENNEVEYNKNIWSSLYGEENGDIKVKILEEDDFIDL